MTQENFSYPPIAVIGVSALFPGSSDLVGFWRDIKNGRDLITDVPPERWLISDYYEPNYDLLHPPLGKTYCKRGAFLGEVLFDCMAFGILPKQLEDTDTAQLLALLLAARLIDDALKGKFEHVDRSRVSCILGVAGATELLSSLVGGLQWPLWRTVLTDLGFTQEQMESFVEKAASYFKKGSEATFPGLLNNVITGRVANKFDLGGTNCTVDAACASSLAALSMAIHELYAHEADMVITGGVDAAMDIGMYMCFTKTPALSLTGDCRPFSEDADGTILGEGLGMVALRLLEDAERDGDEIYGVIRGVGSSSDGSGTAIYAPKKEGQVLALKRAYERAGIRPETVGLIEAHGTGTKAGDTPEVLALKEVFEQGGSARKQYCALGSIKSQIGHTKGAAGAASLIKALMGLHHKVFPPTIKIKRPIKALNIENSPFYLNTRSRPWVQEPGVPRRAGVSAFGFGGTNFHVVLEEYAGPGVKKRRVLTPKAELFLFAGDTVQGLTGSAKKTLEAIKDEESFCFYARQSAMGFEASKPHRLALMAKDQEDLKALFDSALGMIAKDPDKPLSSPKGWHYGTGDPLEGLAFLFPGQGSQYLEMGAELAMAFEDARAVWDRAAKMAFDGLRLDEVVFPIPVFDEEARKAQEERLTATEWAQPAIGLVSLSQLELLKKLGIRPEAYAGHSFGELTALYAAGSLDEEAFLKAARKRGELMRDAARGEGAMAAVNGTPDQIEALLKEWGTDVIVANRNSPKQSVISGRVAAIEEAERRLQEAGFTPKRLPVATAFHSEVVAQAAEPFGEFLAGLNIKAPEGLVYANATAQTYPGESQGVRSLLATQIARPVRFLDQIEAMYESGIRVFLEVGPGRVLTGLVDDILASRPHTAIALDIKHQDGDASLFQALGQMAALGYTLDFKAFFDEFQMPEDPATRKPMRLPVPISGVNVGNRYPTQEMIKAHREGIQANGNELKEPPKVSIGQGGHKLKEIPLENDQKHTGNTNDPTKENAVSAWSEEEEQEKAQETAIAPWQDEGGEIEPYEGEEVDGWVGAIHSIQQQTAEAHMMFLHFADRSLECLEALITGGQVQPRPRAQMPAPKPAGRRPSSAVSRQPKPLSRQEWAEKSIAPSIPQGYAPLKSEPQVPQSPKPTPQGNVPEPLRPSAGAIVQMQENGGKQDLSDKLALLKSFSLEQIQQKMLDVVADKTGYPIEMLELDMDLETDLGIDSIKRVEILSGLQDEVGELPKVDPAEVISLRTLRDVVNFIDRVRKGEVQILDEEEFKKKLLA